MISVGDNLYYINPNSSDERIRKGIQVTVTRVDKGTFMIDASIGKFALYNLESTLLWGGKCYRSKQEMEDDQLDVL